MYQIMTADEAMDLINDGDVIALNSFLGIDIPIELHEALYKRYQRTGSPKHLTAISSAGFGAWDENKAAEGYIRDGAVDKIICGHFGAMYSTKKLVLEDRFEAYNLPLGCISHAIRAQAGGLPGAPRSGWIYLSIRDLRDRESTTYQRMTHLLNTSSWTVRNSSTTSCRLSTWLSLRELLPTARATSHLRICLPQEMRCPSVRL